MRNYLCIILFFVLSLTIPATSAYAYGGGGGSRGGRGGGGAGVKSTGSETINPPSGFKPVKQENADGDSNVLQNISEIKPSSETDPGKEEEVAELVNEVNIMEETAEGTTSDEKGPDEITSDEDQGDKKNLSDDGTDKTGNITNGVMLFLSQVQQLSQGLPQGLQPAVDAVNQAADRTERVEHINNFFHEAGFKPPDLSDDKNLVEVENAVKEFEEMIAEHHDRQKNLAAAAEREKTREALLHERQEQLEATLADYRSIGKFLINKTVTFATGPLGSAVYSIATSDNPAKEGAVQIFGKKPVRVVNFITSAEAEAAMQNREVSERQQQRGQFESVPPSK